MTLLTPRQKKELDAAILAYLVASGCAESAAHFQQEADLQQQPAADAAPKGEDDEENVLERKWLSVIRLQLRVIELEEQLSALQQQQHRSGMGGVTPSTSPSSSSIAFLRPRTAPGVSACLPRAPERATLTGHRAPATCAQFHPTHGLLASGAEDGAIRVWDCETGKSEATMRGHTNSVTAIDFRPGAGDVLASCSSDMSLKLWCFGAGAAVPQASARTLVGHDHTVSSVRFVLPRGDTLLSASRDGTVRQWDAETGFCVRSATGHEGWVRSIAVSPDGATFATGGHDKTVRLWSTATGELLCTLTGHENVVECVAFAERGSSPVVVSGSRDKTIRVWSLAKRECEAVLEGHNNWVRTLLAVPQCPRVVLSGGDDKQLLSWDLEELRCVRTIRNAHENFVVSIAHCELHDHYATASADTFVKLWSPNL